MNYEYRVIPVEYYHVEVERKINQLAHEGWRVSNVADGRIYLERETEQTIRQRKDGEVITTKQVVSEPGLSKLNDIKPAP